MTDDDEIEYAVSQMVARFGAEAAEIARGLARSAQERQRSSAETWRKVADAIERARPGSLTHELELRNPRDAIAQLLIMRAELKRDIIAYETGCRIGDRFESPDIAKDHIRAIKRQIAEYERAITALIPRRPDA